MLYVGQIAYNWVSKVCEYLNTMICRGINIGQFKYPKSVLNYSLSFDSGVSAIHFTSILNINKLKYIL